MSVSGFSVHSYSNFRAQNVQETGTDPDRAEQTGPRLAKSLGFSVTEQP
jgi:hypothetical protein